MKPSAIIIGATTGIGYELTRQYLAAGWRVGATGRKTELLETLRIEYPETLFVEKHDVTAPGQIGVVETLAEKLGALQVVVYNSGVGLYNKNMEWEPEAQTIQVNVTAFTETATWAYRYFSAKGAGQFAGISSLAALVANAAAPAYSASKAFMSLYLEALQQKANRRKLAVYFSDIRPGYIDTPMTQGQKGMFWVISAEKAAGQIKKAIERRNKVAYIPSRWSFIARMVLLWKMLRGW
jgi:short-subunit dehydrogenase